MWKFFCHLPARISRMYMRIYIFCFKKTRIQTKQISISKFIRANLRLFKPFTSFFLFKTSAVTVVFNCKLYLKNSIKLIYFFFLQPPGWRFFSSSTFPETRVLFSGLSNSAKLKNSMSRKQRKNNDHNAILIDISAYLCEYCFFN